jgi:signal transduction histidine kinase
MKHILSDWQHRLAKPLTLRWRLTLWTAGLFLALGWGLVLFINSMTAIQIPQVLRVELQPTQQPFSNLSTVVPMPSLETSPLSIEMPESQTTGVQEIVIRQVRLISLIGIGLFALVGAVGAYWIAKQSLRPVRHLSHLAQKIQVQTLDQRLPAEGPPDEVKELADAFNEMLARLERAFEQQNRFVADAAHELRTPLATLRTNLEVIQRDPNATLSDHKEVSGVLERALTRLEKLVEGLLLQAKGEREIQTEPVEMEVLLSEIVQEAKILARAYQVEISLDISESITVLADAPLLGRAISNLLENGIRYNRPGGFVKVTAQRALNGVEIHVQDTGIGIPLDAQPHIFERFYRVDRSRARDQGGYGIGLSIAAHIVQLHDGTIQLQSDTGAGSTFTIWLPIAGSQTSEKPGL